jgi:uncharacterized phiE125 gp8 family phage protein
MADLTTYAKAKAYMKLEDDADQSLIGVLITAVSKIIEEYIGHTIASTVYTDEVYDGNDACGSELYIKNTPVITLTAIKLYDPFTGVAIYTYTVNDDYILDSGGHKIIMWCGWEKGRNNYKITYTGGYATVPTSVEMACNMFVSWLFSRIGNENKDTWTAGTYDEKQVALKYAMPEEIRVILDPYRVRQI